MNERNAGGNGVNKNKHVLLIEEMQGNFINQNKNVILTKEMREVTVSTKISTSF
jgi:hypothetical protein